MATTEPSDGQARAAEAMVTAPPSATLPAVRRRRRLMSVADAPVRIRVCRTVEELEPLRERWTALLQDGVQTDPDYFTWSLQEEQVVRPHVLAVQRGGETIAIGVARVLDAVHRCKLGYSTVYSPVVRTISVVHDGVLGHVDPVVAGAVVKELVAGLDRGEADAVLFRQLEVDSPLDHALRSVSTFFTRQHAAHPDLRWQIDLSDNVEQYLASLSSGTRKSIRQTARRLEREFEGRLEIRTYRDPEELDTFFSDTESVARTSYQRTLGVGFQGDRAERDRTRLLMEHDWFRGYVLYVDGRPVAFEQGEIYRGRFHSLSGGYDPAYANHRVGAYIQLESMAALIRERGATLYDFGFGDDEYKRRLSHRSVVEADAIVYARRLRPLRVNLVRSALLQTSTLTKAALGRFDLLESVERRWLGRLTRRS